MVPCRSPVEGDLERIDSLGPVKGAPALHRRPVLVPGAPAQVWASPPSVEWFLADDLRHASEAACDAVRRGAAAITIAAGLGGAARVTVVWHPEHS